MSLWQLTIAELPLFTPILMLTCLCHLWWLSVSVSAVRQVAIVGLYLAVLFALYLVPLGMYSPCIKGEGTLGPPPALIGHRGAPMVGVKIADQWRSIMIVIGVLSLQ